MLVLLIIVLLFQQSKSGQLKSRWESNEKLRKLVDQLFPNRTALSPDERQLSNDQSYTCQQCPAIGGGMDKCQALSNLLIQEVYYPLAGTGVQVTKEQANGGTCAIIESLGVRAYNEIFGIGRSFRDTPQCRDIVMQYLCLFWGSNNKMYRNLCINNEVVGQVNPADDQKAARPPCRSFCVQVGQVCANDPEFLQLCADIDCPPIDTACAPDPMIVSGTSGAGNPQSLAANLGCYLPYDINPYFSMASRGVYLYTTSLVAIVVIAVAVTWLRH